MWINKCKSFSINIIQKNELRVDWRNIIDNNSQLNTYLQIKAAVINVSCSWKLQLKAASESHNWIAATDWQQQQQ